MFRRIIVGRPGSTLRSVGNRLRKRGALSWHYLRMTGCNLPPFGDTAMSLGTILLIVLILMLVGAIPTWPHSRAWGYGPSGGLGLIAVVLLILLLTGRL